MADITQLPAAGWRQGTATPLQPPTISKSSIREPVSKKGVGELKPAVGELKVNSIFLQNIEQLWSLEPGEGLGLDPVEMARFNRSVNPAVAGFYNLGVAGLDAVFRAALTPIVGLTGAIEDVYTKAGDQRGGKEMSDAIYGLLEHSMALPAVIPAGTMTGFLSASRATTLKSIDAATRASIKLVEEKAPKELSTKIIPMIAEAERIAKENLKTGATGKPTAIPSGWDNVGEKASKVHPSNKWGIKWLGERTYEGQVPEIGSYIKSVLGSDVEGLDIGRFAEANPVFGVRHLNHKEEAYKIVKEIADKMTGGRASVRLHDFVTVSDRVVGGVSIEGLRAGVGGISYEPIIALSLARTDKQYATWETLFKNTRHEVLHFARNFLIEENDWAALEALTPAWREIFEVDNRWRRGYEKWFEDKIASGTIKAEDATAYVDQLLNEESIAEAFAHFRRFGMKREFELGGRKIVIPEPIAKSFEKIITYLDELGGALRTQLGYRNYRDVFRDLETGKLAQRARTESPRYALINPPPRPIIVKHGGKDFEGVPSLDFSGTGEGSAVYGYGLYTADLGQVAETYKTFGREVWFKGRKLDPIENEPEEYAADFFLMVMKEWNYPFERAKGRTLSHLEERMNRVAEPGAVDRQAVEEVQRSIDFIRGMESPDDIVIKEGKLHTFDVPYKNEDLLMWDVPLSEQPKKVQDAITSIFSRLKKEKGEYGFHSGMKGEEIYSELEVVLGSDRAASEALAKAGIPGHRYWDQGSRDPSVMPEVGKAPDGSWTVWDRIGSAPTVKGFASKETAQRFANYEFGRTFNQVWFDVSKHKQIAKEVPSGGGAAPSGPFSADTSQVKALQMLSELSRRTGIQISGQVPYVDQLFSMLKSKKLTDSDRVMLMRQHDLTLGDLIKLGKSEGTLSPDVEFTSDELKRLNRMARIHRQIVDDALNHPNPIVKAEAQKELEYILQSGKSIESESRFMHWWRLLDAAGRGLLVTLPETVIRNVLNAAPRLTADTLMMLVDIPVQQGARLFGADPKFMRRPEEAFTTLKYLMRPLWYAGRDAYAAIRSGNQSAVGGAIAGLRRNQALIDELKELGPLNFLRDMLFERYAADLMKERRKAGFEDPITKLLEGLDLVVYGLNTPGRIAEYWMRRAKFLSELDNYFIRRGSSLQEAMDRINNGPAEIVLNSKTGKEVIDIAAARKANVKMKIEDGKFYRAMQEFPARGVLRKSIEEALYFTYSKYPDNVAGKFVVEAVKKLPILSMLAPFPIYLNNALRFITEYSPAFVIRPFFDSKMREAIKKGDTRLISKGIVGTGMYALAAAIEADQPAEQKWDEISDGDATYSLRAFLGPFAIYKLAANIARRAEEGRLADFPMRDVIETLVGMGYRNVDTGVLAVDDMFNDLIGTSARGGEKAVAALERLGGDYFSRYIHPINFLKDLYASVNDEESKIRTGVTDPFTGYFLKKIPGASQELPEFESITRPDTPREVNPMLPHYTGLKEVQKRTQLEKELIKQGFDDLELFQGTGDARLNLLKRHYIGEAIGESSWIEDYLKSGNFQELSNREKAVFLKQLYKTIRSRAKELMMLSGELTEEEISIMLEEKIRDKLDRRKELLLKEYGIDLNELFQ